jgi:hypothetical protein
MDPRLRTAIWALAGLALAVGISMAAFAVAGGSISEPAGSVRVVPTADEQQPEHTPKPSHPDKPSQDPSGGGTTTGTTTTATSTSSVATPSPSDDHGGSGSDGSGSHDGNDD